MKFWKYVFIASWVFSALILGMACFAGETLPLASTGDTSYSTEQEAAQAALSSAASRSTTLEMAGGIALYAGRYYPTNVVTSAEREHFNIRIAFKGKLVAIYHTHPGNDGNEDSFSVEDRRIAENMHVHSYIRAVSSQGVYLLADGRVSQIGGHTTCHGMECREYYALARSAVARLYNGITP